MNCESCWSAVYSPTIPAEKMMMPIHSSGWMGMLECDEKKKGSESRNTRAALMRKMKRKFLLASWFHLFLSVL